MKPLRLLTVIGARPQIIKAAALGRAIAKLDGRITETILHTGQHYDPAMSAGFFEELSVAKPHIDLAVGSGDQGATTGQMIQGVEAELLRGNYDRVVVYGDTNSTLAAAIAAVKLNVPVVHIEAGLRSYDKRMPEEVNRVLCDHSSTWLFCPTSSAVENLRKEGFVIDPVSTPTVDHPQVMHSGDVMYDNALHYLEQARNASTILAKLGLQKEGYILATVHRAQNTDDAFRLRAILEGLRALHTLDGHAIVLPLHPRTRKQMEVLLDKEFMDIIARHIRIIPPVGYLDMLMLEHHAKVVVTDSGGVQKEAAFLRRPVVVLRPTTEWVELVEACSSMLADADTKAIVEYTRELIGRSMPAAPDHYGDGRAAETICNELLR